ncbi:hypothetical protein [Cellulosimicrobium sp. E-16]|uniref:hypothetical protein n=1 Tax=Cellulosimicrobium sp. E-16 TaxID=3404049 RepID=UPI003CEC9C01
MNDENLGTQARIERSIAAKQALRPKVDHNGHPIDDNLPVHLYDKFGRLVSVNGIPVPRPDEAA